MRIEQTTIDTDQTSVDSNNSSSSILISDLKPSSLLQVMFNQKSLTGALLVCFATTMLLFPTQVQTYTSVWIKNKDLYTGMLFLLFNLCDLGGM